MSGADDHIGVAMARAARQREAAERRTARKNLIEFKRRSGEASGATSDRAWLWWI